jgi:hypothetical protein
MDTKASTQLNGECAMARYKDYDLNQAKMIPISYADQIVEGSFEHALNEIVEEHLDLSVFEQRYANDATGRRAYDPKVLLKIARQRQDEQLPRRTTRLQRPRRRRRARPDCRAR